MIRTGIGGWTFEPWRGVFYPKGLKHAAELEYAAAHLATIEINGTYYSSFKPESWAKWKAATPDGFKFAVKASRFCTNRKVLSDGKSSMEIFLNQGLTELGDRLGPILWQFAPTKKFDRDEFAGFLALLPERLEGLPLKHVVEVRNATFADEKFVRLCRDHNVAICNSENENYPLHPRRHGRLRLHAAALGRRRDRDRLHAGRARPVGRTVQGICLGRRAGGLPPPSTGRACPRRPGTSTPT
ncbi:DUF72 domain-containing protein [Phenylobacterium sp. J367]|uniref:DUF72 domain-containing protein n=1 Tax=Phenylobacterium sp. J367 TaxID=2898435 RepID=UPI0035B29EC2